MSKIPVSAAAKMAGVQRSTLYRKNDKGELSFNVDESGNKCIDASELLRVYPNAKITKDDMQQSQRQQMPQDATSNEYKALERELEYLREKLSDKEKQLDESKEREQDLSKKLDSIIENSAQEKVLLLEDHKQREINLKTELAEATKAPKPPTKRFLGIFPIKS